MQRLPQCHHGSDRLRMASLAIEERKGNLEVANAAVFPLIDLLHGILRQPLLDAHEYLGMAAFAPGPDRMFCVRINDVLHAFHLCIQGKILLHVHRVPFDGHSLEKVERFDEILCRRLFPVYPVPKTLLRELIRNRVEVEFPLDVPPDRVAPFTITGFLLRIVELAGCEDRLGAIDPLAVMAGPAIEPPLVVRGLDVRAVRLHGEREIDMAEPAGEQPPMQPVIEFNRRQAGLLGIIVDDHVAVLMGQGPFFLDPCLRQGKARKCQYPEHHHHAEYSFHSKPLSSCYSFRDFVLLFYPLLKGERAG